MLDYEKKAANSGFSLIIGVDESGRGPLAGPVVASAVCLKTRKFRNKIKDSKSISARQRQTVFDEILGKAYVGVGIISESVIDKDNILQATFFAMNNAVADLIVQLPEAVRGQKDFEQRVCLLIDGHLFRTRLPYAYQTIIRGDTRVLSIACASIVAKVTRDRILKIYDKIFPEYGFREHKGYATLKHRQALERFGLSIIHRKTFQFLSA